MAPGNRFSRNRASGLPGYQVNKELDLMADYLFQTIDRPGAANGIDVLEANSTLHIVGVYNLGMHKRTTAVVPLQPPDALQ